MIIKSFFSDTKQSSPKSCLPLMVPHFTGRKGECEEITAHMTSGSTRIVSIWGSPGFGKTSVAIAVGHHLDSQGLPVYFLSLRGLQSKADLTSKLLSFFTRPATNDQQQQRLSLDDELFQLFNEISDPFVLILDNADDLLENGMAKAKEDFIHFLEEILSRTEKVTFVITTRESLEFMNVQFQGHHAVRICPLDEVSSQTLVHKLLPNALAANCIRIQQICGHVPLAMKLLCSSISEDDVDDRSQVLDEFTKCLESNDIVEMLDNPDYPSHLRLKLLFDSSFQRLPAQEKKALVSMSVLPESFDLKIAAAVLGISVVRAAKSILQSLRRRSFLDSGSKSELFTIHKLLQSFARERGEQEMKETILDAQSRLRAFYVSRFEELNEQFLTGNSMSAFIEFYEHEQSFLNSLIEGCYDSKTSDNVFRALVKAELFLDSLFWCEGEKIDKMYDSAIEATKKDGNNVFYRQLLVSLAFTEVTWGSKGRTMQLISDGKYEPSSPDNDIGKHLCYSGIYQLVTGKTEHGVQLLQEALSLMNGDPEQRILKIILFQILAVYHRSKKNSSRMSMWYTKALEECRAVGDTKLLIIPAMKNTDRDNGEEKEMVLRNSENLINAPLTLEVLCIVNEAIKHLPDPDTKQYVSNVVLNIAKEFKSPVLHSSLALFNFQRSVNSILQNVSSKREDAAKLSAERILYLEKAIEQCKSSKESLLIHEPNSATLALHQEALANSYADHADIQCKLQNYSQAVLSAKRALDIRLELRGEEHSSTAASYHSLGVTQHEIGDFSSARQSAQRALDIRRKLFGEKHSTTADSYHLLGITQHELGDFSSALQSKLRALDITLKLFGENHSSTAYSYHSLALTQHEVGDFSSALQFTQRALDIRLKLFGEEHSSTADSYHSLGILQHKLGDVSSALQSTQRGFDIRLKLFGEEHSSTADSYYYLGTTQHALGDFSSALQSAQRELDIRIKLFGEEHSSTANSYHSLGLTQHEVGDFSSALQSTQRALDIRIKLFGEEHSSTADSYYSLATTQHALGDFSSALQSAQRELDIRLKLFGEEHSSNAKSYYLLRTTQYALGDFSSALQSAQRELDIRLKLFGEEHSSTANSYHSLGLTT